MKISRDFHLRRSGIDLISRLFFSDGLSLIIIFKLLLLKNFTSSDSQLQSFIGQLAQKLMQMIAWSKYSVFLSVNTPCTFSKN